LTSFSPTRHHGSSSRWQIRLGKRLVLAHLVTSISESTSSPGEEVAIKLESVKARHPQLNTKPKFTRPWLVVSEFHGLVSNVNYNAMVIDLLGPSLDLFNFCERKFSLKTTLLLADLLSRIEYVHSRNFIHRDIKPDNFLMGVAKRGNQVNIIDFGLAKKYRDPREQMVAKDKPAADPPAANPAPVLRRKVLPESAPLLQWAWNEASPPV
ncbi:hypothetical protein KEM48_008506, partial [Puccinia striiformis f. sp. tritici PST-130]